ncbi:hypothetical protein [Salinactinospora qingdaonensis]|uniref:Uncharacterized protein n=1 Tax=Salinactinospora qingdaonensis TaxID=702744 RepID=A0ABP7EUV9_9ACTN
MDAVTVHSTDSAANETDPQHHITLALDPAIHADLRQAAGAQGIEAYLRMLLLRHSRWSDTRTWLAELEATYGRLPAEALEGIYRKALGMPRRPADGKRSVTLVFDAAEFAALSTLAGERPVAPYAHEVLRSYLDAHAADGAGAASGEDLTSTPTPRVTRSAVSHTD